MASWKSILKLNALLHRLLKAFYLSLICPQHNTLNLPCFCKTKVLLKSYTNCINMYEWLNVASYLQFQGVYNNDQWLPTSEWGLSPTLLRVGDCCWWYVLFKRKLVWSHSTAGKSWFMRALCTLDAYGTSLRCCAVGPICLEMGLHTSSSRWLSLFPSLSLQLLYTHIGWSGSHKRAAIWTITGCLGGVVHSLLAMLKVFSYCRWLCLRKSYYAFTWRIRHLQQWYLELEIFSFCRVFFPKCITILKYITIY